MGLYSPNFSMFNCEIGNQVALVVSGDCPENNFPMILMSSQSVARCVTSRHNDSCAIGTDFCIDNKDMSS